MSWEIASMNQVTSMSRPKFLPDNFMDCMTDNGPTQCNEPIWIHGSPGDLVRSSSSN